MTISERVYRLILRAYPAEYRREYEEPMLQLWRDQLRHCGGSRRRVALLWGRTLADTLRAAPAMHLETVTGLGGWLMRSRIALAMLASLLFLEVGKTVLAFTVFRISSPFTLFMMRHRPEDYDSRPYFTLGVFSVIDSLEVALALMVLLMLMRAFHPLRLGRGALAALAAALATREGLFFLSRVLSVSPWPVLLSSLVLVFVVGLFLLLMTRLGVGRLTGSLLAIIPVSVAGIWLVEHHISRPAFIVMTLAGEFSLPICFAAAVWAANGWGRGRNQAGPDQTALPIPG